MRKPQTEHQKTAGVELALPPDITNQLYKLVHVLGDKSGAHKLNEAHFSNPHIVNAYLLAATLGGLAAVVVSQEELPNFQLFLIKMMKDASAQALEQQIAEAQREMENEGKATN